MYMKANVNFRHRKEDLASADVWLKHCRRRGKEGFCLSVLSSAGAAGASSAWSCSGIGGEAVWGAVIQLMLLGKLCPGQCPGKKGRIIPYNLYGICIFTLSSLTKPLDRSSSLEGDESVLDFRN